MARVIRKNKREIISQLKATLQKAKTDREELETEWKLCQDIYHVIPPSQSDDVYEYELESTDSEAKFENDYAITTTIGTQAQQFLQSKLCVSEPVVTVAPTTRDRADKLSADCIRGFIKHVRHHTDMQERLEGGVYHNVATVGIGIIYIGWDMNKGAPIVPEDWSIEDEFEMEGGLTFKSIHPHDFWIDPNVDSYMDARCCIHREMVPMEVAIARFPEKIEQLKTASKSEKRDHSSAFKNSEDSGEYGDSGFAGSDSGEDIDYSKVVPIYYYWEKHTPENGMRGRFIPFTNFDNPKPLVDDFDVSPLPYKDGELPFEVLTDLDVSGSPYGLSRTLLVYPIIQAISQFYSIVLANIDLHGSVHLLLPEGSAQKTSNHPASVYYFNPHHQNSKPVAMQPSLVTGDIWRLSEAFMGEIQSVFGMNEFSQGQVNRELASYAVQLAIETDDKFRVRLFNKKKRTIIGIYKKSLSRCREFMADGQHISILGLENYSSVAYFKAGEVTDNFRIDMDYGNYLPPDPTAKKNQVMELLKTGVLEKAGLDMKKIISVLVDGDMLNVKDMAEGAQNVQEDEINRILIGEEVQVTTYQTHEEHLSVLANFMNSIEFEVLDVNLKQKILDHKQGHVQKLAALKAASQPPPPGLGGPGGKPPPPPPGQPPM